MSPMAGSRRPSSMLSCSTASALPSLSPPTRSSRCSRRALPEHCSHAPTRPSTGSCPSPPTTTCPSPAWAGAGAMHCASTTSSRCLSTSCGTRTKRRCPRCSADGRAWMARRPAIAELWPAYDAQYRALVGWLAALPEGAWKQRSVLSAWTVAELAFHTTEVPASLTRALAGGPVAERPLTIAGYVSGWAPAAADIAERDRAGAAGLRAAEIVARHEQQHAELGHALEAVTDNPTVRARRGPITVADFLATRVNELVVHSRDLSASLPQLAPVPLEARAVSTAPRILLGVVTARPNARAVQFRVPPYAA